jgi:hypothetical protein
MAEDADPHQALGYLTPAEYLASLGVDVQRRYRTRTTV